MKNLITILLLAILGCCLAQRLTCSANGTNFTEPVIAFAPDGSYREYKDASAACGDSSKEIDFFVLLRSCLDPTKIVIDCIAGIFPVCGIFADGSLREFGSICDLCLQSVQPAPLAHFEGKCPTMAASPYPHYCTETQRTPECYVFQNHKVLAVTEDGETRGIFDDNCKACQDEEFSFYYVLTACPEGVSMMCPEDQDNFVCGIDDSGESPSTYRNPCLACDAGKKFYYQGRC